jgi:hypothetical protein
MPQLPQMSLPPVCTECQTTIQPAQDGAPPQQFGWNMLRSADGKTRVDYPNMSVISDPAAGKATILDHVKKEVREVKLPDAPKPPDMPQMPQMPGVPGAPPTPPNVSVQDLGKRLIDGHEVEGKQFTAPPDLPKMPSIPKPPAPPAMPGMPQPPAMPAPPPMPTVTEVWTSTQTKVPVLTKVSGAFGRQISQCKPGIPGEPNPAAFQIPPEYKKI